MSLLATNIPIRLNVVVIARAFAQESAKVFLAGHTKTTHDKVADTITASSEQGLHLIRIFPEGVSTRDNLSTCATIKDEDILDENQVDAAFADLFGGVRVEGC